MYTRNKNKKRKRSPERKRSPKLNRTLDFPSKAASAAAAAAGLPNSDRIASNAMSNDLFVRPTHLSTGFLIRYNENDSAAAPAQRSNSARTTSSSLSELDAIHKGPESYEKYLDNKKNTKGTNTYARVDEDGDVIMGGRKTRRKKRRRKTKKRRKTKRKKRRRKRKTKKRRK